MRKNASVWMAEVLLTVAVTLVLVGGGAATVHAGDPALHVDNFSCGLFDGDGNVVAISPGDGHFVSTSFVSTHSGKLKATCHATGLLNTSGKVAKYSSTLNPGTLCVFPAPNSTVADTWTETVTGIGDATLQCQTK